MPISSLLRTPSRRRRCASDGYLAAIADGYRDFGFDDLAPLREAQVEAITNAKLPQRTSWLEAAALSPPWAPGVAWGCE